MRLPLLLALLLVSLAVRGQEPVRQDGPIHTLRVFTNSIQIPTLVLDEAGAPVSERTHPHFTVSLDGGKPFPATHARLEGEDPISLTILLDASGSQDELLRELNWSLPKLFPGYLRPHDHVSVYALDCALVKSVDDVPADKAVLRQSVVAALKADGLHGAKSHGACADKLPLRDTFIALARTLSEVPGRRVILAFTNGNDTASKADWALAGSQMQHFGTTVFSLAAQKTAVQVIGGGRGTVAATAPVSSAGFDEDFNVFTQISGGLVLTANDTTLTEKLSEVTRLLRARYIVEFPRSDEMTAGTHPMQIRVAGKQYFIRSAGASLPIADPKLKDDPTVLRLPKDGSGTDGGLDQPSAGVPQ